MGKLFITLNEESQEAVLAECRRLNITLSAYCSLMMEWCATTQEGHAVIQSLITGAPLPSVNINLAPLVQSSITNAAKEKEAARKKFTPVETFTAPLGSPGTNHRQHCRRQPGGWRHHSAGHPAIP